MTSVCVLVLIGATVTFWPVSLARMWFLGSSNIDLAVTGPEALWAVAQTWPRQPPLLPVVMATEARPAPRHTVPLPVVVPLSDQLVVFHQFFQSSIDSGLCTSEARVLWRWP